MEARDLAIGLAGAAALLAAIAGVMLNGFAAETTAPDAEAALRAESVEGAFGASGPATSWEGDAAFTLDGPYVARLRVNLTLTASGPFPSGGTLAATLVAPDGATYETVQGIRAGASEARVVFDVAPAPPPGPGGAPPMEPGAAAGAGEWRIAFRYDADLLPAPGLGAAYEGQALQWAPAS